MAKLVWGQAGDRIYEAGVDHGVLYPETGPGVPWNGLVSVTENSEGGEVEPFHFDGVKYLDLVQSSDFQAEVSAFSSPSEFAECDGSRSLAPGLFATQQPRKRFGMSYRTKISSDTTLDLGYKIHLIYNATASPTSRVNTTLSDSVDISPRQWTVDTVPPYSTTHKPTAHFVIDSTKTHPFVLDQIQDILYGTDLAAPRLISVVDLIATFGGLLSLKVVETSPGVYQMYSVADTDSRTLMQPNKPSEPDISEQPILWLDSSAGNYVVPKLVTGG